MARLQKLTSCPVADYNITTPLNAVYQTKEENYF